MADLKFRKFLGHQRWGALSLALLIAGLVAPAAAQASGGAVVPGLSAVPAGAQAGVASAVAHAAGASSAAMSLPAVPSPPVPSPVVSPPPVAAPAPPVKVDVPAVKVSVPAVKVSLPVIKVPVVNQPGGTPDPAPVTVHAAGIHVDPAGIPAIHVPAVNVPAATVPRIGVPAVNVPAIVPDPAGRAAVRTGSPDSPSAVPASSRVRSARPGRVRPIRAAGAHHLVSAPAGMAPGWTGHPGETLAWPATAGPFLGAAWAPARPGGHPSSAGGHRLAPVLRIVAVRRAEPDSGAVDITAGAPVSPPVSASLPPGGAVSTAGGGGGAAGAVAAAILALAAVALLRALLPGLLAWDLVPWRSALLAVRLERPG